MITINNVELVGMRATIRGMRNPMNSWGYSDSNTCENWADCNTCPLLTGGDGCCIHCKGDVGISDLELIPGPEDFALMKKLAKGGSTHAKYKRMMTVYLDIKAPLYWWKEFDTYKVGTVSNSCSTMHKIHDKPFDLSDFSHENLFCDSSEDLFSLTAWGYLSPLEILELTVKALNHYRKLFIETKDKQYWQQMIQLLPTSYNQLRTVMLNYEVLTNIYGDRRNHKLDEWVTFCKWIETLPYSELITGNFNEAED